MSTAFQTRGAGIQILEILSERNQFAKSDSKTFMMSFPNGCTVIINYGKDIPSTNQDGGSFSTKIGDADYATAVQVCIFDSKGSVVRFKDGELTKGNVSPSKVLDILNWVSTR